MSKKKKITFTSFFLENKKILLLGSLCCAFLILLFLLLSSPKYLANAVFNERENKSGVQRGQDLNLLIQTDNKMFTNMQSMIRSRSILRPIIHRYALQGKVHNISWGKKIWMNIRDTLYAEFHRPLKDIDQFVLSHLYYDGEEAKKYYLFFVDATHFVIKNPRLEEVGSGVVGKQTTFDHLRCTILRTPQNMRMRYHYLFTIDPWQKIYEEIKKPIQIVVKKNQGSLVELKLKMRNRHLAAALLNGVMQEYMSYLEKEHQEVVQKQMQALVEQKRIVQKEFLQKIQDRVATLEKQMAQKEGMSGIQKLEDFIQQMQECQRQIFAIEKKLAKVHKEAFLQDPTISAMDHKMEKLRLQKTQFFLPQVVIEEKTDHVMADLVEDIAAIDAIIVSLQENSPITVKKLHFDAKGWLIKKCTKLFQKANDDIIKKRLGHFLQECKSVLQWQKKMMEKSAFFSQPHNDIKLLIDSYHKAEKKQEEIVFQIEQLQIVQKQMKNRTKAAVLYTLCIDEGMKKLLEKMDALEQKILDKKNYSEEELFRFFKERTFYRKTFYGYLHHMHKILLVQKEKTQQQLMDIHRTLLSAIDEKIINLEEQKTHYIQRYEKELVEEKAFLESKYAGMHQEIQKFPQQWKKEKLFDLQSTIYGNLSQYMEQFFHSHATQLQMQVLESKPFDYAVVPLYPQYPYLFLLCTFSFFFAFFCIFSFLLFKKFL